MLFENKKVIHFMLCSFWGRNGKKKLSFIFPLYRWVKVTPAQAGTTPLANSYTPTLCCSSSSPQLSHFCKHIGEKAQRDKAQDCLFPPWDGPGVTWELFPFLCPVS